MRVFKLLFCVLLQISLSSVMHAQTITQLFLFPCDAATDSCSDGANVNSLIQASDGNIYGTTRTNQFEGSQGGTIFKLTPSGRFTRLFTFQNLANGNAPSGGLVEGENGFLFGVTASGGAHNQGVVFKISKTGTGFRVLHSFCADANCSDGASPLGSLTMANDGSFFGTTRAGGKPSPFCPQNGCGTVFRITQAGSFRMVHALDFASEGTISLFGLLKGSDGNIYGLDRGSGDNGNIFRVTPKGEFSVVFTLPLFDFTATGLVQAANGDLFGATLDGEAAVAVQLFSVKTDGSDFQSFAPSFDTGVQNDFFPNMIQASDGNLWGVVPDNGVSKVGTLFSLALDGTLLRSITFDGTNGIAPNSQLLQKNDGTFVGTTFTGGRVKAGKGSGGTIFALDESLPAPVPSIAVLTPSSGAVGSVVKVRGSNFIGSSAVTFNGVSASFQVLNSQFIRATVPAGATTGSVQVMNVGGAATSTQPFTIN